VRATAFVVRLGMLLLLGSCAAPPALRIRNVADVHQPGPVDDVVAQPDGVGADDVVSDVLDDADALLADADATVEAAADGATDAEGTDAAGETADSGDSVDGIADAGDMSPDAPDLPDVAEIPDAPSTPDIADAVAADALPDDGAQTDAIAVDATGPETAAADTAVADTAPDATLTDVGLDTADTALADTTKADAVKTDASMPDTSKTDTAPDVVDVLEQKDSGCTGASDCAADSFCQAGSCVPDVCVANSAVCSGAATVQSCLADGSGVATAPCGSGQVCLAGTCVASTCTPDALTCANNHILGCDATGQTLAIVANCTGQICTDGACLDATCLPGETTCTTQGHVAVCGTDGKSWKASPCAAGQVCDYGGCVPTACDPSSTYCDGSRIRMCDAIGLSSVVTQDCAGDGLTCNGGVCVAAVCEPWTQTCVGASIQTCAGDGLTYTTWKCGAKEQCQGSHCVPMVCTPNTTVCDSTKQQILSCDASGMVQTLVQDCGATGAHCNGTQCVPVICTPGEGTCTDTYTRTYCSDTGEAWLTGSCNSWPNVCSGGKCVAQKCVPSTGLCHGSLAALCNADGMTETPLGDCAAQGLNCVKGVCAATLCQAGTAICNGDTATRCAPDGQSYLASEFCATTNACLSSTCDPASGCVTKGAACNDGNACTTDTCANGNCVATAIAGAACNDGNPCTTQDKCVGASCGAPPIFQVETLAGRLSVVGFADGPANAAVFATPWMALRAKDGSIVVSDTGNNRIRRVAGGIVTTLTGTGVAGLKDGRHDVAQLNKPQGMDFTPDGLLYIADNGSRRLRKMLPDGRLVTASAYVFTSPHDVLYHDGSLFIADEQHLVRLSLDGKQILVIGYPQTSVVVPNQSWIAGPTFGYASALSPGPGDTLLVTRSPAPWNGDSSSALMALNGAWAATQIFFQDVTVGAAIDSHSFLAATHGSGVHFVTAKGSAPVLGGTPGRVDGTGSKAGIVEARAMRKDTDGSILIADGGVRRISWTNQNCDDGDPCTADSCGTAPGTCVHDALGTGAPCDDGDPCTVGGACQTNGVCASVVLNCEDGNACTFDVCNPVTGNCDNSANTLPCNAGDLCNLRMVCGSGSCATDMADFHTRAGGENLDGIGTYGYVNGQGKGARFKSLGGLARGPDGLVYVADPSNNAIRSVDNSGNVLTAFGWGKDAAPGPAGWLTFTQLRDLRMDRFGFTYVTRPTAHQLWRVGLDGWVEAWGTGVKGLKDGPVATAHFANPSGVAVASTGWIYVADTGNAVIRRISPDGMVETWAGSGVAGHADGPLASAQFKSPIAVAMGHSGDVYVADGPLIRHITAMGQVSTIAGIVNGGATNFNGGPALTSSFSAPGWLAESKLGDLYISDGYRIARLRNGVVSWLIPNIDEIANAHPADGTSGATGIAPHGLDFGLDDAVEFADDSFVRRMSGDYTSCDDGNFCTTDACDPFTGACTFVPLGNSSACDDGNACTTGDVCVDPIGCVGSAISCDDGDPCTSDTCSGYTGTCAYSPTRAACEDADHCTTFGDQCNAGQCEGASATIVTLAGFIGTPPYGTPAIADGRGDLARFGPILSLCGDGAGNTYAVDSTSPYVRRVGPDGWTGNWTSPAFVGPARVACRSSGLAFVWDASGIYYIGGDGSTTFLGKPVFSGSDWTAVLGSSDAAGWSATADGVVIAANGISAGKSVAFVGKISDIGATSVICGDSGGCGSSFTQLTGIAADSHGTIAVTEYGGKLSVISKGSVVASIGKSAGAFEAKVIGVSPSFEWLGRDTAGQIVRWTGGYGPQVSVAPSVSASGAITVNGSGRIIFADGGAIRARGVASGTVQSAPCNDNDPTTTDTCDPATGACTHAL
jgi:hypothetical protein